MKKLAKILFVPVVAIFILSGFYIVPGEANTNFSISEPVSMFLIGLGLIGISQISRIILK